MLYKAPEDSIGSREASKFHGWFDTVPLSFSATNPVAAWHALPKRRGCQQCMYDQCSGHFYLLLHTLIESVVSCKTGSSDQASTVVRDIKDRIGPKMWQCGLIPACDFDVPRWQHLVVAAPVPGAKRCAQQRPTECCLQMWLGARQRSPCQTWSCLS